MQKWQSLETFHNLKSSCIRIQFNPSNIDNLWSAVDIKRHDTLKHRQCTFNGTDIETNNYCLWYCFRAYNLIEISDMLRFLSHKIKKIIEDTTKERKKEKIESVPQCKKTEKRTKKDKNKNALTTTEKKGGKNTWKSQEKSWEKLALSWVKRLVTHAISRCIYRTLDRFKI